MKTLSITLLTALLSLTAIAQDQTLLNNSTESGFYGAFFTKFGNINGETGTFMGGQLLWVLDHKVAIGGKGYALINQVDIPELINTKLEFGCYGGLIEYIIASDKLIHLNVNTMIGAGSVRYSVKDWQEDHSDIDFSEDVLFVVEPGLDAELNIHKNLRIGIGVYYRIVSNVDYAGLSAKDLNGFSGQVTLKIGKF